MCVGLAVGLLAGTSAPHSRSEAWPSAPLASSFVTPAGSWAILPMGHLSDPLNTFWQLFFRPSGRTDWTLVTPPGVADNGGLAASPGPNGSIAVVFDATNFRTFSPLAFTYDNGSTWSDGVIPFGTESIPDVLIAPQQPGARLAVLDGTASRVEDGTGIDTNWSIGYTRNDVANSRAGRSCGVGELTALAAFGNDELLGSDCATPGVVGIFRAGGGSSNADNLQLIGPKLGASEGEFTVLRLSSQGDRIVALVYARIASGNTLYGMWRDGKTGSWSVSQAFALPSDAAIVSSGFGPDGSLVVESKSVAGGLRAAVAGANGGTSWRDLPPLPAGTESVSVAASGKVDALSASLSQMTDWSLGAGTWRRIQVLTVPIQYGSSG